MTNLLIPGLIATAAVVVCCSWLSWQFLRQNGRILLRIEELEKRVDQMGLGRPQPEGLPLGAPAPDFDLAGLDGERKTLGDLRGQSLLLIFFNPGCGFCRDLVPKLATLKAANRANRHPLPLIIAIGDAEHSRRFFAEHQVRCPVLLQQESDVSSAYGIMGTPSGYLIDAEGNIASAFALGAEPLLALADRSNRFGNGSLARSKIKRDGLNAGTPAPDFRLPRVDGRDELSLSTLRGRRVLIVFSSPCCEPCNQLAPRLQLFHRDRPDVELVMVSNGEPFENRAKVKEHGLSFPVVLQQGWATSRSYAIFVTPAAYLINREGVIVRDVTVGIEPILRLLASL